MSVVSDRQELEQLDDVRLAALTREGNNDAYAELWNRHSTAAARAAQGFTSVADPEDLVADAYLKILTALHEGGGPTGAFRPYLFTTVRNLAKRIGRTDRSVSVDDFSDYETAEVPDDPAVLALNRSLTATAFRSLPERWQTVLWYTEVEGMEPQAVAPLLGMTANGVAALSYRARDGLRDAWLEAHISSNGASEDCSWSLSNIRAYTQGKLSAKKLERLEAHLETCTKCTIISEEVDDVASRLNIVVLPLVLGSAAGLAYNALIQNGTAAMAATALPGVAGMAAVGTGAASSAAQGGSAAAGGGTTASAGGGGSATAGAAGGAGWVLPAAIVAGVAVVGGGIYGLTALAGAGQEPAIVDSAEAPPALEVLPPATSADPEPSIANSTPPSPLELPDPPATQAPAVQEPVNEAPAGPIVNPEPTEDPVVPVTPAKPVAPKDPLTVNGIPIFASASAQFTVKGTPGAGVWVSCSGPSAICTDSPMRYASTGTNYILFDKRGTATLPFSEWSKDWPSGDYSFSFGYDGGSVAFGPVTIQAI